MFVKEEEDDKPGEDEEGKEDNHIENETRKRQKL